MERHRVVCLTHGNWSCKAKYQVSNSGVANTFICPTPPIPLSSRRRRRPSPRLLASSAPIDEEVELKSKSKGRWWSSNRRISKGRRRSSNQLSGGGGARKGCSEARKLDSRRFAPAPVGHGHNGVGQLHGGRRQPRRSPPTVGAPPSLLELTVGAPLPRISGDIVD